MGGEEARLCSFARELGWAGLGGLAELLNVQGVVIPRYDREVGRDSGFRSSSAFRVDESIILIVAW